MSGLFAPSAAADVWSRSAGFPSSGPIPLGGSSPGIPTVNNPNLSSYTPFGGGSLPPPIPQPPTTPFPNIRPALGPTNTNITNNYATANTLPSINSLPLNLAPNPAQNEAYQRRLNQLEDENAQRRDTTVALAQLGTELLLGQMDVQEQVLQYQYMLEECFDKLDYQNDALNEQEEQLGLLRSQVRHLEYLIDAYKHSNEGTAVLRKMSEDCYTSDHGLFCCGDPISLPPPSTSPFFAGGPTRATASTFQPFNPRYRSPNSRAAIAASLNAHRSVTPSTNKPNLSTANERPSRRFGNFNR